MAAPDLSAAGTRPSSWASSSASIISAWDKEAGVENPIVGPPMEISLIYSPRLPQAFCPRLFVSCSQLVPRGSLSAWQNSNWAVPSLPPTTGPCPSPCPFVPTPVTATGEEREGRRGEPRTGHLPQPCTRHSGTSAPSPGRRAAPNTARPPEPCLGSPPGSRHRA